MNHKETITYWSRRNKTSLDFYDNKAPYKAKVFNKIFQLDSYFEELIGDKKEVYIADLGAGLFSTTGSTWPDTVIHLYPSDILAEEYSKILIKHKITPLIPIEKQDMLNLTYEDNFFDIVHCVNAIDHCYDPMEALQEMYRVCKEGGWIYLKHFLDNAELRHYHGAHQWNVNILDNGDSTFWSRKNMYLLSDYYDNVETSLIIEKDSPIEKVVNKIRKGKAV